MTQTKEQYNTYHREYRKRNKIKENARKVIFILKRSGELKYKPCEMCGEIKSEAHHDDYKKILKIRFLCKKHHIEFHKNHKYDKKTLSYKPKKLSTISKK